MPEKFKIKYLEGSVAADALVVGLAKGSKGLEIVSTLKLDENEILQSLNDLGATGKVDEVIKLPGTATKVILFSGLGKVAKEYSSERIRRAAGIAAQSLHGHKSAIFAIDNDARAMAEGAALGSYSFTDFRGHTKKDQRPPLSEIFIDADGDAKLLKEVEIIVKWTFFVRDLVNMPPSYLNPKKFAELVSAKAKKVSGVKIKVWDEKQLESQGFGGLIGVGQGSANPPRLVSLSYKPAKAKRNLAYVGKGITFDSGGLALKPADKMDEMKFDMCGAAGVLGTLRAIAQLKPRINVIGIIPATENMPDGMASKPGDIVTSMSGQTVEILNTDAEGRLILCDALTYCSQFKPAAVVDIATLTGACVIALGHVCSGLFANNQDLALETLEQGRSQLFEGGLVLNHRFQEGDCDIKGQASDWFFPILDDNPILIRVLRLGNAPDSHWGASLILELNPNTDKEFRQGEARIEIPDRGLTIIEQ